MFHIANLCSVSYINSLHLCLRWKHNKIERWAKVKLERIHPASIRYKEPSKFYTGTQENISVEIYSRVMHMLKVNDKRKIRGQIYSSFTCFSSSKRCINFTPPPYLGMHMPYTSATCTCTQGGALKRVIGKMTSRGVNFPSRRVWTGPRNEKTRQELAKVVKRECPKGICSSINF